MVKYSRYLFLTFLTKWSGYIIIIVGILASAAINVAFILGNRAQEAVISHINIFMSFLPFLFTTLFSVSIVLHIFKSGEDDGSELLIVSKPLTRKEIIFSKFFVTFILMLIYQLIMIILFTVVSTLDKYATTDQRIRYVLSFFIGGLIVGIIMTTVIILLSSFFNKVGLSVVSAVVASTIPIISFTLIPLGHGTVKDSDRNLIGFVKNYDATKEMTAKNLDPKNVIDASFNVTNELGYSNRTDRQGWYGKVVYFDLWYQWGRFYDIFNNDNYDSGSLMEGGALHRKASTWTVNPTQDQLVLNFNVNNEASQWVAIWPANASYNSYISSATLFADNFVTWLKLGHPVDTNEAAIYDFFVDSKQSAEHKLSVISRFMDDEREEESNYTSVDLSMSNLIKKELQKQSSQEFFEKNKFIQPKAEDSENANEWYLDLPGILATAAKTTPALLDVASINEDPKTNSDTLMSLWKVGSTQTSFKLVPWISNAGVLSVWIVIAILAVGGASLVYIRRDFK